MLQTKVSLPEKLSNDSQRQLSFTLRVLFLVALLAAELLWVTLQFEPSSLAEEVSNGPALLFVQSRILIQISGIAIAAFLLMVSPHARFWQRTWRREALSHTWWLPLLMHGVAFGVFAGLTFLMMGGMDNRPRLSLSWIAAWTAMAGTLLGFWLWALAPLRWWRQFIHENRYALAIAAFVGAAVRLGGAFSEEYLWDFLRRGTFQLSGNLVGSVYTEVVYEPEIYVLGTPEFTVSIATACSGVEGIVLVTTFLGLYFWLFRKHLRFPQAFLLIPAGIAAMWCANSLRIAALIVVGTSLSPELAVRGFHSYAGWISFTAIGLGLLAVSHRFGLFSKSLPATAATGGERLAIALLAPQMTLLATSLPVLAFSSGFDTLYPVPIVATAAVLWYFRKEYSEMDWRASPAAVLAGSGVFALWVLAEPAASGESADFEQGLADFGTVGATAWLAIRALGSTLIVPMAEELAFRGYLLRKLIAKDFENVAPGQFTWLSFLGSSLLFGLMHQRWLSATLAGMVYALALYRRGRIGDAVAAHVTSNALIAVWVLTLRDWSLWGG